MKSAAVGMAAGLCVVLAALALLSPGLGRRAEAAGDFPAGASANVLAFPSTLPGGDQQITLVDVQQRVLCVYHVDQSSGEIALKCVRNFHWDTQLSEFNGVKPLPDEIRQLLRSP